MEISTDINNCTLCSESSLDSSPLSKVKYLVKAVLVTIHVHTENLHSLNHLNCIKERILPQQLIFYVYIVNIDPMMSICQEPI